MFLGKLLACLVIICLSWCIGLFYKKADDTTPSFMEDTLLLVSFVPIIVSALFLVFV